MNFTFLLIINTFAFASLFRHFLVAFQVTDDVAPNYSKEIARPIDLKTMLKKLDIGAYRSLKDLDADMELMFTNCIQYNGLTSAYGSVCSPFKQILSFIHLFILSFIRFFPITLVGIESPEELEKISIEA
jgi:hypothetical protein